MYVSVFRHGPSWEFAISITDYWLCITIWKTVFALIWRR